MFHIQSDLAAKLVQDKDQWLNYVKTKVLEKQDKTIISKRCAAFSYLVNDWLNDNIFIGTSVLNAICLVAFYHQKFTQTSEVVEKNKLLKTLTAVVDEFEELLGHSFRLVK